MSEEEKKAIDDLFSLTHINGYIDLYTQEKAKIHTLDLSKWQNGVKVLLNLIENQQKEIEELNFENHMLKKWNEQLDKNCISKDKIREKIKEQRQKYFDIHDGKHSINEICFESTKVEGAVEVLKELLGGEK